MAIDLKNKKILTTYLDEIFPNAQCELNYFNDYSFLIAVMLSAQCTDKKVNKVTKVLFEKYKTLEDLANILSGLAVIPTTSIPKRLA